MAAREISDLIDRGRKILGLQKLLIDKKNEIKISLDNEIKEIRMHCSRCNVTHGASAAITTVGALAAAFNPAGLGLAIGVPFMAAGKLISFDTDCTDAIQSNRFIKKAMDTVASQESLVENLRKELDDFQEFLKTIREKNTLKKTGLKLTKRFGGQLSSLVQSNSDTHCSPPTDIDGFGLCKNLIGKCKDVKDFVDILNMQTLNTFELIIKGVLVAISVIKEIGNFILSWKSTHPTENVILGIRGRLVESIKTLECLSEDLEKNVKFLEEKRSEIKAIEEERLLVKKAIETYEEISDLVNALISKQKKTVDWIFKELDKMSNRHWATWITAVVLGPLMSAVAFVAFMFGLVQFGSLIIIAALGLISVKFTVKYGDVPSKPAVIKMLNELKCPGDNCHFSCQYQSLRQLLESVDKTSNGLRSGGLKEEIVFTPHKNRPLYKAAKRISEIIHGEIEMIRYSSKQSLGSMLLLASLILEALCKLEDVGFDIGRWAIKNGFQERLVSQLPDDLIDYTESIGNLLEVLQTDLSPQRKLTDKLK